MRFYTADTHFGHKNIIKYSNRPFEDVDHMNTVMINNINEVAGPADELWILGDMAMGRLEDSLALLKRITPEIHLVNGNHDRTWTGNKGGPKKIKEYMDAGVQSIQDECIHYIAGAPVQLSHFPYKGSAHADHTEIDRFEEYRPIDKGFWLLCGHVHESWKKIDRMINVGVDVRDYYPVSEYEVEYIIKGDE